MRHPFLEAISNGVLLADGATGTELRARGWRGPSTLAVIDRPELVRQLHEDYIAAGADIILTNTFIANAFQLERLGVEHQVRDMNLRGARLARDAREISGRSVFIGGSVGPIGRDVVIGGWSLSDARHAFMEQIEALVEGGVDVLVIETFPNLEEAQGALQAAREVTDIPVVALCNFNVDLCTPAGEDPQLIGRTLESFGADVVGVNCGVGPQAGLDILQRMVTSGIKIPVAVEPNAGMPRVVEDQLIYPSEPAYFADFALRAKDLGAVLIGGCCGTTPEHLGEMRKALGAERGIPDIVSGAPQFDPPVLIEPSEESSDTPEPSRLRDKLAAGKYVISVEIDPPRGGSARKAIEGAMMLRNVGVDAINIGDSPMARVRMSALSLAVQIQSSAAIETIIHQTTRDRNLMALQADMLGAHALGIRNVIALSGDPPPEAAQSSAVWDIDSTGFIRVLKRLNDGVDFAGNSIGRPTDFFVACAVNPTAEDVGVELRRVRAKLEAGADVLMTQPVYESLVVREFFERLGSIDVPVLLGVMPLVSWRNAEFVHNELAGVTVSRSILDRMRNAGESSQEAGIEIALEHIEDTKDLDFVSGIYLMPAFGRYEVAAEIVKRVSPTEI